uniref:Uncharacterized protein n=1 Tax=Oryza meridionalis TaxID=40149 RepID=A0A0E0DAS6_9ORYZ
MGRSCKQEHELTSPQAGVEVPPPIDTVLGGHVFMKLPPLEDQLCFDADASAANGLAYYSAAATRLLGGANGSVIGSDDDLWSFMQSAPPAPLPSAPLFPSHTAMAASRP